MHAFDIAQPEVEGVLSYFGPFKDSPRLRDIDGELTSEQVHDSVEEQVAMLLEKKRTQHAKEYMEKQEAAEEAAAADVQKTPSPESQEQAAEGAEGVDGADVAEATAEPAAPAQEAADKEVDDVNAAMDTEVTEQLVKMTDLPAKVESLEDKVFRLLLQQWQEMQENFTSSIRQLFRWHRSHLSDFRRGAHGMQHRFLQYVSRIDDKQEKVDEFVWKFNAFSEEYPDMRKQDLTKEELHQQVDDLHDVLKEKVNARKDENMTEWESIKTSRWVESHLQVLAAQIQHAVRLEAQRYHSSCQLLSDFYYGAIGAGLPEQRDPCPKIEALKPDPETGVVESSSLREFVPASEEGGQPAHWEFPFVKELLDQAQQGLFKPVEWCTPSSYEKKEEAPDPKGKAKAKGRASPAPGKGKDAQAEAEKPAETPPLFVDLQQALITERVHYQYRLAVIRGWAQRRLLQATEASEKLFVQLRDWALLRKKKELDSCLDLVDVLKEHIESEDLITSRLTLDGAHLHRHPNVHLQTEFVPEEPPQLESGVPYRWTIAQLNHLLETVEMAARALNPSSLQVSSQALLTILMKITQAPQAQGIEQPRVPACWRPCDIERLQSLCAIFDQTPRRGTIDACEFLLSIGLHHSPLGWPSVQTLQEVRTLLENEVPAGCSWPDFYITEDVMLSLPLFQDPKELEAALNAKFQRETSKTPAPFDRCREQIAWLTKVFCTFVAPVCQQQRFEVELSWYEHQMRIKDEDKVFNKLLDDCKSGNSTPVPMVTPTADDAPSLGHSPAGTSEEAAPQPPPGPMPRPSTPRGLPVPPAEGAAVSVRQLITYLCLGASLEDGLTRAAAMMGPSGATATTLMPLADFHAAVLQFGARPTPPSLSADGRPQLPSLREFCKEIGVDPPRSDAENTMSVKEFLARTKSGVGLRFCERLGLARRHSRVQVEKLFPERLEAGAKVTAAQRIYPA